MCVAEGKKKIGQIRAGSSHRRGAPPRARGETDFNAVPRVRASCRCSAPCTRRGKEKAAVAHLARCVLVALRDSRVPCHSFRRAQRWVKPNRWQIRGGMEAGGWGGSGAVVGGADAKADDALRATAVAAFLPVHNCLADVHNCWRRHSRRNDNCAAVDNHKARLREREGPRAGRDQEIRKEKKRKKNALIGPLFIASPPSSDSRNETGCVRCLFHETLHVCPVIHTSKK